MLNWDLSKLQENIKNLSHNDSQSEICEKILYHLYFSFIGANFEIPAPNILTSDENAISIMWVDLKKHRSINIITFSDNKVILCFDDSTNYDEIQNPAILKISEKCLEIFSYLKNN